MPNMKPVFLPGDVVQLSGEALCANLSNGGRLFRDLDESSRLVVTEQIGVLVLLEPNKSPHRRLHCSWLLLAPEKEKDEESI